MSAPKAPGFLERVLAERCEAAEARARLVPETELRRRAAAQEVRDFRGALRGAGRPLAQLAQPSGNGGAPRERIIAEVKRRSPSIARYRQQGDPAALASAYAAAGAAAISIVTDETHFGTSLAEVPLVRQAGLPVLVKDFVTGSYQVLEARAAGADAVLLIARALAVGPLADLLALVRELGICALVECHDERDLDTALTAGADVVGVNSRDLSTLQVSLDGARRLLARAPAGVLRVAESGIISRAGVLAMAEAGADAFLIGGVLLQAEDPGAKLRELLGTAPGGNGKGTAGGREFSRLNSQPALEPGAGPGASPAGWTRNKPQGGRS